MREIMVIQERLMEEELEREDEEKARVFSKETKALSGDDGEDKKR
jgi:hypothetical protein